MWTGFVLITIFQHAPSDRESQIQRHPNEQQPRFSGTIELYFPAILHPAHTLILTLIHSYNSSYILFDCITTYEYA